MTHQDPHSRATDPVHEHQPVEAQYVRQGRGGVRILAVLILSAGAAAILLLGMWLVSNGGFARQNIHDGDQIVDARAFQEEPPAPPAADAPTTTTGRPTAPPTGQAANVNAPTVSGPVE